MKNCNYINLFDSIFILRGFFGLMLIPMIFILDVEPFSSLAFYSNIYFNNDRYPNLNLPYYFCLLFLFFSILNITVMNFFFRKFTFNYSIKNINNIDKNIEIILYLMLSIFFILKFRGFFIENYFSDKFISNFLIKNINIIKFSHFFIPNEILYFIISIFIFKYEVFSRYFKIIISIIIFLVLISSINFGSRYLQLTSLVLFLGFIFKLLSFKKIILFVIPPLIFIVLFKIIIPVDINFIINQKNASNIKDILEIIFDHLIWRLDVYHLVDIGYDLIGTNFSNNNKLGHQIGVISFNDTNTGIGLPAFYSLINNHYSIFINSCLTFFASFITVLIYVSFKNLLPNFGFLFLFLILSRIIFHWPESSLTVQIIYFFKVAQVLIIYLFLRYLLFFYHRIFTE